MVGPTPLSCQCVYDELNLHSGKLTLEKNEEENGKEFKKNEKRQKKSLIVVVSVLDWRSLASSDFWFLEARRQ